MSKCLCDWKSKRIEEKITELEELLRHPTHLCKKCARCANKEKVLCKPKKISGAEGLK